MLEAGVRVHPGEVLAGKFRVEKILGRGGMGVVVAAFHLELEQRVALKFLLPAAAEKPEVVSRFAREARALAKLRSEYVARVMDVAALEDGTPYIMMEYLEGRTLSKLLRHEGPIPIETAVDYVLHACVALAEAHSAGIIHRDLKPSNLFLARQPDGTEILKLLDFGIAKMPLAASDEAEGAGAMTATSDMFGSPRYMSPEQLKSFRNVDARSDLWALGVIFYEAVSGVSPFRKDTVGEIFWAVAFDEPPLLHKVLATVPEELALVIARCLQKDPTQRFANAADLAQALLPFGSDDAASLSERAARMTRQTGYSLSGVMTGTEDPLPVSTTRSGSKSKTAQQRAPQAPTPVESGTTLSRAVTIDETRRAQPSGAPKRFLRRPAVAIPVALSLVAAVSAGVLLLLRQPAAPALAGTTHEASSAVAPSPAQVAPPSIEPAAPPSPSASLVTPPSASPTTAATSASAALPKPKAPPRRSQPSAPVERPASTNQHDFGDRR